MVFLTFFFPFSTPFSERRGKGGEIFKNSRVFYFMENETQTQQQIQVQEQQETQQQTQEQEQHQTLSTNNDSQIHYENVKVDVELLLEHKTTKQGDYYSTKVYVTASACTKLEYADNGDRVCFVETVSGWMGLDRGDYDYPALAMNMYEKAAATVRKRYTNFINNTKTMFLLFRDLDAEIVEKVE